MKKIIYKKAKLASQGDALRGWRGWRGWKGFLTPFAGGPLANHWKSKGKMYNTLKNTNTNTNMNTSVPRPNRKILTVGVLIILACMVYARLTSFKEASAAWFDTSWGFRKKLTIDYTKVSGGADLASFPILVKLTDSNLRSAQSTGNDILFTSSDGSTKLDHEIEKFTQSTGELVAWVRIPTLSYTANTIIYMYYGNPGAASQQSVSSTWNEGGSNNFKMVLHLNESSGHHLDATSNNTDTVTETVTQQGADIGKIDGADNFDGTDDYLDMRTDTTVPAQLVFAAGSAWTYSHWMYWSGDTKAYVFYTGILNTTNPNLLLKTSSEIDGNAYHFAFRNASGGTYFDFGNSSGYTGSWVYLTWVADTSNNISLYINGTYSTSVAVTTSAMSFEGFARGYINSSWNMTGKLDELRISNTNRSAGWITTEYNNQNSPSTFLSSGGQEKAREPVAYWKFDEGTGVTTTDSSKAKIIGTFAGAVNKPTWQTEDLCVSGKCLFFEGSNANLTVANTISNVQSVSFWEKTASSSGTIPLLKLTSSANISIVNGTTVTATGFNSPTVYVNGLPGSAVLPNVWNHIEVTDTAGTSANAIVLGTINSVTFFKGFLDDVKLFDTQRTADQVKADYNSKSSATSRGASVILGAQTTDALNKGLVGYWKMDEATWSGTLAEVKDSSGNSNDGQAQGATGGKAYPASGKFANGGYFDGVDDYVNIGNMGTLINATYAMWINMTNSHVWPISTSYAKGIILDSSIFRFRGFGIDKNVSATLNGGWKHIVVTADGLNVKFYLSGVNIATFTQTSSSEPFSSVKFGQRGDNAEFYAGTLDEVRIYNRALSSAEVQQLYNFAPGPIGYWKMDEKTGTTANDSSGNNNSGTLGAGTTTYQPTWTSGKIGSALKFDGTNDYVSVADNSVLDPSGNMSLGAWFKLDSLPSSGNIAIVLEKNISGSPYFSYRIYVDSDGLVGVNWRNNSGTGFGADSSNTLIVSAGTWYYAVGIKNETSLKIYVNGNNVTGYTSGSPSGTGYDANSYLSFGATDNTSDLLKGIIDDVRIYNYALTGTQIKTVMNENSAVRFAPLTGSP